jgi:hypothetical protein
VVRQRDNLEIFFKNLLVEDKGLVQQNSLSYVEYLYHLHREIKNILSYWGSRKELIENVEPNFFF